MRCVGGDNVGEVGLCTQLVSCSPRHVVVHLPSHLEVDVQRESSSSLSRLPGIVCAPSLIRDGTRKHES